MEAIPRSCVRMFSVPIRENFDNHLAVKEDDLRT